MALRCAALATRASRGLHLRQLAHPSLCERNMSTAVPVSASTHITNAPSVSDLTTSLSEHARLWVPSLESMFGWIWFAVPKRKVCRVP